MSRAKVQALVRKMGLDLETDRHWGGGIDLDFWAPDGQVFKASGCHSLVVLNMHDTCEAWAEALEQISEGLEPCDNPECDTCADDRAAAVTP